MTKVPKIVRALNNPPEEVAQVIGKLTILHGNLERILLMSIKRMRGDKLEDLFVIYKRAMLGKIIVDFTKVVEDKKLTSVFTPDFLDALKNIQTERNQWMIHCFYYVGDDENLYQDYEHQVRKIDVEELENYAEWLSSLIERLNSLSFEIGEHVNGTS